WLDAPTTAPAWPHVMKQRPGRLEVRTQGRSSEKTEFSIENPAHTENGRRSKQAIEVACLALIEAEAELTELDRITGDGDLGASMKRAALAMQNAVDSYPLDDIPSTLKALAHTLRRELGGS